APKPVSIACDEEKKTGKQPASKRLPTLFESSSTLKHQEPPDAFLKHLRTIGEADCFFIESLIEQSHCELTVRSNGCLIFTQMKEWTFDFPLRCFPLFCLMLLTKFFDRRPIDNRKIRIPQWTSKVTQIVK